MTAEYAVVMLVKGDPPHSGKQHKAVALTITHNFFDKTSRNLSDSVKKCRRTLELRTADRKSEHDI